MVGDRHAGGGITDRIALWFGTLGPLGTCPGPAGTYGAAAGVIGFVGLNLLPGPAPRFIAVGLILAGIPICHLAARTLRQADPSQVIWDEFATMVLLLACLPRALSQQPWIWLVGFLLHRVFDITKPPPICHLERLPGGWGIMADDIMAAALAWLALFGIRWMLQLG